MDESWTEKLFLEHADLFLEFTKTADERSSKEVDFLEKIFLDMGVQRSSRVLDLCCGYGRHALRLAEKGFFVTGVDISSVAIKHARELAKEMKVQNHVEFHVGDARKVFELLGEKKGSFSAVISMWTSLGYYDEETDRRILKQINKLASPSCVLVIEMGNRDYVVKHFQPFGINDLGDKEVHEYRKFDLERSQSQPRWEFYKKEKNSLKHLVTIQLDHRMYSLHELIELLKTTGWEYTNSYGSVDHEPVTADSNRIIIVGKRKTKN